MSDKPDADGIEVFGFFNEVGIINQLSTALLAECWYRVTTNGIPIPGCR